SAMGSEPPGAPRMQTHNAASGDESAMGSEPPGAPRMQAHNAASGDESCRRETGVCVQSGGSAPLCGVVATERTTADFARAKPRDILCGVVATERTTADFARALSGRGGEAVPVFTMQTEQTEQTGRLRTELSGIEEYEWVLFFSKQAAVCFFEAAADTRTDLRRLAGVKFGVIGTGTEAVLKDHGIYADFMPEKADAEAFAEAFVRQYAKSRVLFPRAARGNPAPAKIMARAGCSVCEIPAYDMKGERGVRFPEWFTLRTFAFFSASGVQAFFEELSETKETLPAGSTCCCIGESTRDALKRELEERMSEDDAQTIRILVPEKTSVSGMAEEIARLW
ncbi:MAG: uroporphyrinogen-III synthase, partial [Roseburia sp.]|nr:uroporphyrinogen-III synthase [Roseburia sp.]